MPGSETKRRYDVIINPQFYLKFSGIEATSANEAANEACEDFYSAQGELLQSIHSLEGQCKYFRYAHIDNESDVQEVEIEDVEAENYVRLVSFGVSAPALRESISEAGIDYEFQRYVAQNTESLPPALVVEFSKTIVRRYGHDHMSDLDEKLAYSAVESAADGNADALRILVSAIKIRGGIDTLAAKAREIGILEKMAIMSSGLHKTQEFLFSKDHPSSPYYQYSECVSIIESNGLVESADVKKALAIMQSKGDVNPILLSALNSCHLKMAAQEVDETNSTPVRIARQKRGI